MSIRRTTVVLLAVAMAIVPGTAVAADHGKHPLWGIAWQDLNGDGQQQPDEPGLPGVRIHFDRPDGPLADVTDEGGYIHTEKVPVGVHHLYFELPAGYAFSPAHVGDPGTDSDVGRDGHAVTEMRETPSGSPDMPEPLGAGFVPDEHPTA